MLVLDLLWLSVSDKKSTVHFTQKIEQSTKDGATQFSNLFELHHLQLSACFASDG